MKKIYEPDFVTSVFDKMSDSYNRVNLITSFGFSQRWRKKCVREFSIGPGQVVVDLMSGMGECWDPILENANSDSRLIALDLSGEMIRRARIKRQKLTAYQIQVLHEDVFSNSIPDNSADYVVSGFGLKTFDQEQLRILAKEIGRILKPNGKFSLVDVSVPDNKLLRITYMFYIKSLIPLLGRLLLGNPEPYRMLGIYTEHFQNSSKVLHIFKEENFQVEYLSYFYGCATGIKGRKE